MAASRTVRVQTGEPDAVSDKTSSRREREFLKYAEAVLGLTRSQAGITAISSSDRSLTAFAQLVALRLNAKRAIVSLFDKKSHYILTEATRTLSLQDDNTHDDDDALYWGKTILPRTNDFTALALKPHNAQAGQERGGMSASIIPDLEQNEQFSQHTFVVSEPHVRCFVGVPLLTTKNYPIGTLAFMDDKPRPQGVTEVEVKFMQDVAASIMSHLEMARVNTAHQRSMRMVNGISRFMEGKDMLAEDSSKSGLNSAALSKLLDADSAKLGASSRTHFLNDTSNAERVDEARIQLSDSPYPLRRSSTSFTSVPRSRVTIPKPHVRQGSQHSVEPKRAESIRSDGAPSIPPRAFTEYQEDVVPSEISQAFGRASGIIQQAMDLAGILFLDASTSEFGSLRSPGADGSDDSESGSTNAGSNEETAFVDGVSNKREFADLPKCRLLAGAYGNVEDDSSKIHHDVPERFLRSLMKRFPYGKVLNFGDDDGLLSSDELSDSSSSSGAVRADTDSKGFPRQRRRKLMRSDADKIQQLFPGVRALGIVPMWDSHREKFFASAIVWSYNRARFFTFQDDLNYLGAFCDVIMAEIGRLDVLADVTTKTSFISSISHELRSPLHGILGAAECLTDADDESSRQHMIQMIDTCGRSLLDIINNLLQHSASYSAGHKSNPSGAIIGRRRRKGILPSSTENAHDLAILTEEVIDSALFATPQPAPQSAAEELKNPMIGPSDDPLKVVLEIDNHNLTASGWQFHVNAGAWRRILQNITSNAIKYTDRGGYFKVTLSVQKAFSEKGATTSLIELNCTDSGRGMSKEFLGHGIWQEFKQEDSNIQGTGLGLNLVQNLVDEMGGHIIVDSTKGQGTSIKITVTLKRDSTKAQNLAESSPPVSIRGQTFGLIGFEDSEDQNDRATRANDVLRSAIVKACQTLGLTHFDKITSTEDQTPDIFIVSERDVASMLASDSQQSSDRSYRGRSCIVLCDSVSSSRAFSPIRSGGLSRASIVSQPLGPRKLLKAITSCLSADFNNPGISPGEEEQETPLHFATLSESRVISEAEDDSKAEPMSAGAEASRDPIPAPIPASIAATASVLLVDDNQVNLTLLQRYMKKVGRPQISATNGLQAVEAYQKSHTKDMTTDSSLSGGDQTDNPVGIIFMDITMPIMDGMESTRRIRAHERTNKLKPAMVIALTALASPQARREAYGSGINVFLTKPVRFKEIEEIIADWDKRSQHQGASE